MAAKANLTIPTTNKRTPIRNIRRGRTACAYGSMTMSRLISCMGLRLTSPVSLVLAFSFLRAHPLLDFPGRRRRKPGPNASKFKINEDTGKMIIDEGNDD